MVLPARIYVYGVVEAGMLLAIVCVHSLMVGLVVHVVCMHVCMMWCV